MKDENNKKTSEYDYQALANWVRQRACGPCRSKDESSIVYDAGFHKSCQKCERLADWLQGNPIIASTLYELSMWVESKRQQKSEWQDIRRILSFASRGFVTTGEPEIGLPHDELAKFAENFPEIEMDESALEDTENEEPENDSEPKFDVYFQQEWT
jgi:hypothetical protein